MEATQEILQSTLFAGMDREAVEGMLACLQARIERYAKGERLLREGETTGEAGLLLRGSVWIVQDDFWGNRNLRSRVQPGELFAEAYACTPMARMQVSAEAGTDCTVLWLRMERVIAPCETACAWHREMAVRVMQAMADKMIGMSRKLTHMEQRTLKGKLLSYLSAQAAEQGKAEFDVPLNRQQMADYLGVERSALSTALGALRDEGRLRFKKSHFVLLDDAAGEASALELSRKADNK